MSGMVLSSSCPALCRASTSSLFSDIKDVDGRGKPGHDDQHLPPLDRIDPQCRMRRGTRKFMNVQKSKEILEALVGFDTVSRNSNLDCIAWIEGYLDKHGVKHQRVYDETGQKSNVWATIGP